MAYAAIDVGSNTVRLLVGDVEHGEVRPFRYARVITRLAAAVDTSHTLSEPAVRRTLEALRLYAAIVEHYASGHLRCVGTSALREALNAGEVVAEAEALTGVKIEVVSGREEAELTALGVLASLPATRNALIVDIGGGSTELIVVSDEAPGSAVSAPVGVVRMLEAWEHSDPPSPEQLRTLIAMADKAAAEVIGAAGPLHNKTVLIGTAGTICSLAAVDLGLEVYDPVKVHGRKLDLARLESIRDELTEKPLGQRARTPGLERERADLIVPGVMLTIRLMTALGFSEITVSNHGLLEGVLLGLARQEGF